MIEMINYSKRIKGNKVLNNINLKFENGKVYLLRGNNGSGKTMLLRALCGLIRPSSGEIKFSKEYSYGVIIENPSFMENETAYYNLKYLADIKKKINKEDIDSMLRKFGLINKKNVKVKKFSLGMKHRLALIQAFMEDPDVILLDEPFNALDEYNFNLTLNYIKIEKEKGKIIVIAAHSLDDELLNLFFDHIINIKKGTII